MDLGTIAGIGVAIAIPTAGGFISYGVLRQRVKSLEDRVHDAEEKADSVAGLAGAVEHLADKFSAGLTHIGEMFALNNQHVTAQLNDIKDELKNVRANRVMTNGKRPDRLSQ